MCSSPMNEGDCVIRYGQDSSYQDLGPSIKGSLNSNFTLPLLKANTLYYYQINATINFNAVQLEGNFRTGECECT